MGIRKGTRLNTNNLLPGEVPRSHTRAVCANLNSDGMPGLSSHCTTKYSFGSWKPHQQCCQRWQRLKIKASKGESTGKEWLHRIMSSPTQVSVSRTNP